jgi:hypothetical protein
MRPRASRDSNVPLCSMISTPVVSLCGYRGASRSVVKRCTVGRLMTDPFAWAAAPCVAERSAGCRALA